MIKDIRAIYRIKQGEERVIKVIDKSLKDILKGILDEYDFKGGPLFKLTCKNTLHSSLIEQYPFLENGELDMDYIDATIKKASDIYRHLDFRGDLFLVYDNVFNPSSKKEAQFLESILVKLKRKEEYSYEWFNEDGQEFHKSIRRIYQVEALKIKELFQQIVLSDFGGDYDLVSSIFIIDIDSKTIFHLYDDRGLYIMAREEKILQDLWKSMSDSFFEDCHDFEIKIKKLYWIDGTQDNKEDLCLHGDLKIRINDQIVEYSPTVSAAGLRLLRSLFEDHQGEKGKHLFPCCGNIMIANEEGNKVEIIGCDQGLDWSVRYKDGLITIKADKNTETTIYYLQYKKEVLNFIKEVENFYKKAGKRILPEDKVEMEGYLDFWKEWEYLKERATLI